jgi:hypothetical protein
MELGLVRRRRDERGSRDLLQEGLLTSKILVAAAVIVLACSCARPKPTGAQIDPALSILIPPDTVIAVALHADKLRMTPVYQKYLAAQSFPQLDGMAHLTGMDPRKDLWQLLFLSDAKHNVILGRGNFGDDMELKLEREGAKRTGYKSYYLVGSDEAAVVFFNSTTAAVGNGESLKALLDARGKSNGPPPAMAERMKEIPADAQMWAVYIGGPSRLPFDLPGNLGNVNNIVTAVRAASFYLDLHDGVKGAVHAVSDSEAGAKSVHDALKAFVGFGRLMTPQKEPDLMRVYDGLQITQDGASVNVKIEESPDLIEKFLNSGIGGPRQRKR